MNSFLSLCALLICANINIVHSQTQNLKKTVPFREGVIVTDSLISVVLKENKIDLNPVRKIKIYLPPSYTSSRQAYPVVFYFHSILTNAEQLLQNTQMKALLDRAISNNVSKEFILVIPDCSSPTTGSLYENSSTSGRWLDFICDELVPHIDANYRTITRRECRALTGDFMGGRGALKLAMTKPDMFNIVYALHPVATGMGYLPWTNTDVNWKSIHSAKTYKELAGQGLSSIFLAVNQAFLPNPQRPPFYCDFFVEEENGELKVHAENMKKAKDSFLLDHSLYAAKNNLSRLKAIAFDWGRFDPIQDHVVSATGLSKQLKDVGIKHEAEEYAGIPWENNWGENGRFYTRLLPFLNRYLEFK